MVELRATSAHVTNDRTMIQSLVLRFRNLVARKLGVCPFCMRTSALGSLGLWLLYTAMRILLPGLLLATLVLIPATAFSLLFLSHLVAYMIRAGARLRAHRRAVARRQGLEPPDSSRREFLATALRAGGYALVISFLGDTAIFGQVGNCDGTFKPKLGSIYVESTSIELARKLYAEDAIRVCDRECGVRDCTEGRMCLQSEATKPVPGEPECKETLPGSGTFYCYGKVKECTCACNVCDGDHRVPDYNGYKPPGGAGEGPNGPAAEGAANQNALDQCATWCSRFENCEPPKRCKCNGLVVGEFKNWPKHGAPGVFKGWVPLKKFKCKCV